MKRRILLLNVGLLLVIAVLAQQLVSGWWEFEQTSNLRELVRMAQKQQTSAAELTVRPPEPAQPFAQFAVLPERDLFSPERRPPVPEEEGTQDQVAEAAEEEPPELTYKPFLYGTSTVRGQKQAWITILNDQNKREPLQVKLGDDIQGYKVTDIGKRTLTLTWRDHLEVIHMSDAPAQPAEKKNVAVTVITVGAPVQAVTASETAEEPQADRGLQVAVVGRQQGPQQVQPGQPVAQQQARQGLRQQTTGVSRGPGASTSSRSQRATPRAPGTTRRR